MFTDDIIIPTKDNCFVIKCPDGQYAFYLYGKYITTFPNKEHCIIGITTYKNIQEARKHEKIISEKKSSTFDLLICLFYICFGKS